MFSKKRKEHPLLLKLNGHELSRSKEVKSLDMDLGGKLKFKQQIMDYKAKVRQLLDKIVSYP